MTIRVWCILAVCALVNAEEDTVGAEASGKVVVDGKTAFLPGLTNLGLPKTPVVDKCALDGTEATNDMIDAAVFIWAAVERCGKPGKNVKCEVDITSAISSITSMVNVVVKALHNCHVIKTASPECGLAVGKLARSASGIAASSGGIADRCPNAFAHAGRTALGAATFADQPNVDWHHGRGAVCLMDLKDAMRSLIKGSQRMQNVKKDCDENEEDCTSNAFKILSAFAAIGQYVMGALGHCQHGAISASVNCGADIANLIRQADDVAVAGESMSKHCFPLRHAAEALADPSAKWEDEESSRLFAQTGNGAPHSGTQVPTGSMNIVLMAMLPLTMVAAFVRGARSRPQELQRRPQERECEALVEVSTDSDFVEETPLAQ